MRKGVRDAFLAGLLFACAAAPANAAVTYLGNAIIDGNGSDASGQLAPLEDGSRANALDGFGSGIAYTGYGNRYVLLADRGPNKLGYAGSFDTDNTVSYKSRFQVFDINVVPSAGGYTVSPTFVTTSLLRNEAGQNFVGLSNQITSPDPTANLRLDPESIRVAPDGTVYISDEYGPNVYHFDSNGNRIGVLPVPAKFQVAFPMAVGNFELGSNSAGRVPGKGMEGLAITPDGTHVLAAMQGPLIQDGSDGTRYTRMVYFDTAHPNAAPKEFLYKLNPDPNKPGQNASKDSVCDVVAINDHEFLVDERDGAANQVKHAYKIDITGAQDISNIDSLSALSQTQIDSITSVTKSAAPLIDIGALTSGLLNSVPPGYRAGIPDKVEGFTFGPDLPDGRKLLLVTNDDDFGPSSFIPGYPNYIMAFAIDPADLQNFQPEQFTAPDTFAPEPGALSLFAGAMMLLSRRQKQTRKTPYTPGSEP